jgi:hypothetical protein
MFSFGHSSCLSPLAVADGETYSVIQSSFVCTKPHNTPEWWTAPMLLQTATHQAAGSLARRLRCITPHVAHNEQWSRARCSTHAAASSSSVPSATAAAAPAPAAEHEQQNLPHVSVLLQEVLHNLNHMPIKVLVCRTRADAVLYVCLCAILCFVAGAGQLISRASRQGVGLFL